jgi:hypothetical protein
MHQNSIQSLRTFGFKEKFLTFGNLNELHKKQKVRIYIMSVDKLIVRALNILCDGKVRMQIKVFNLVNRFPKVPKSMHVDAIL